MNALPSMSNFPSPSMSGAMDAAGWPEDLERTAAGTAGAEDPGDTLGCPTDDEQGLNRGPMLAEPARELLGLALEHDRLAQAHGVAMGRAQQAEEEAMIEREAAKGQERLRADTAQRMAVALDAMLAVLRPPATQSETPPPAETKKPRLPGPPKFRNPQNHDQTWTGRGRQPGWAETCGLEPIPEPESR